MIQARVADLFEGWNEGDADKLANAFAPQARLFTENGSTYVGRDQIREAIARKLSQTSGMKLSIDGSPDIHPVTDDVAVVEFCVRASSAPQGVPTSGRWVAVAKQTGGEWQVAHQWVIATPNV